jgi:hypothetical protein
MFMADRADTAPGRFLPGNMRREGQGSGMSTTEIDRRLRARQARLAVLGLVGQGETAATTIVVQLRRQGFADREIGTALNHLLAAGVLGTAGGQVARPQAGK